MAFWSSEKNLKYLPMKKEIFPNSCAVCLPFYLLSFCCLQIALGHIFEWCIFLKSRSFYVSYFSCSTCSKYFSKVLNGNFLAFNRWPLLFWTAMLLFCCSVVALHFLSCVFFPGWMVVSPPQMSVCKVNCMYWCSWNNGVLMESF